MSNQYFQGTKEPLDLYTTIGDRLAFDLYFGESSEPNYGIIAIGDDDGGNYVNQNNL